jgi:hypothetical protein
MTASPTNEALDDLVLYIRQTLPQPKAIHKLEILEKLDAVRFHWQGREFLVRKNMDVLELKGDNLYMTGTSILIQSVLMKKTKNEKVLGAIEEVLKEAEELIAHRYKVDAGLRMLQTAKAGLMKLMGKKPAMSYSSSIAHSLTAV